MVVYKLMMVLKNAGKRIGYWFKHLFSMKFYVNEMETKQREEISARNRNRLIAQLKSDEFNISKKVETDKQDEKVVEISSKRMVK